jgi:hypothetical protein
VSDIELFFIVAAGLLAGWSFAAGVHRLGGWLYDVTHQERP